MPNTSDTQTKNQVLRTTVSVSLKFSNRHTVPLRNTLHHTLDVAVNVVADIAVDITVDVAVGVAVGLAVGLAVAVAVVVAVNSIRCITKYNSGCSSR